MQELVMQELGMSTALFHKHAMKPASHQRFATKLTQ